MEVRGLFAWAESFFRWPRRWGRWRWAGVIIAVLAFGIYVGDQLAGWGDFAASVWRLVMDWPVALPSALMLFAVWAFFQSAREEEKALAENERRITAHTQALIDPVRKVLASSARLMADQNLILALEVARMPMDNAYSICLETLKRSPSNPSVAPADWHDRFGELVRAVVSFNQVLAESAEEFKPEGMWPFVGELRAAHYESHLPQAERSEWRCLERFYQVAADDYHRARSTILPRLTELQKAQMEDESESA